MTTTVPMLSGYAALPPALRQARDQAALRDALRALDGWAFADTEGQLHVEQQITAIRSRLDDRGAAVDESMRSGHRHVQAAPDHRDPPGTVRWVAVQPDGTRIPRGARIVDDMAGGR